MQRYFTVEQIAKQLQVNKATVYAHIRSGSLPAYKIGAIYRVAEEDLEAFLAKLRTEPTLEAPTSIVAKEKRKAVA